MSVTSGIHCVRRSCSMPVTATRLCQQHKSSRQLSPSFLVLLPLTLLLSVALSSSVSAASAAADSPLAEAQYEQAGKNSLGRIMGLTSGYLQGSRSASFTDIERATTNEGRNLSCVVEGDIRICDGGEQGFREREGEAAARHKRQTVDSKYYELWRANTVKYVIDRSTYKSPVAVASTIRTAMDAWESKTCLRFVEIDMPSDPDDYSVDYLYIYSGSGCWSYVARLGGRQDVSLSESGCIYKGVVMHELGHAMGLVHQQSRPDRDSYTTVLTNNIRRGYAINFFKSPCPTVRLQVRFDIESVMQYGLSDFATALATIRPKSNEYAPLAGNRASATHYDYMAVSSLYQCRAGCNNACENDGYPLRDASGACTCVCPYGLGGPTCASYDSTKFACGGVIQLNSNGSPYSLTAASSSTKSGKCAWLFKAPKGKIVKISFQQFSVATSAGRCAHYVEVRKNMIGQSAPVLYCGNSNPDDVYTRNDYESNAAMVIFDYTVSTGASSFSARVSAYFDGCLGDRCRGAPCQSQPGSSAYQCLPSLANVSCAFEKLSSASCTAIRLYGSGANGSLDCNAQQRTWEVIDAASTTVPAHEGAYFISSDAREDEGTTARGSFRIVPHGFRMGVPRCLRFAYFMESSAAGTLNVYRSVNGDLGGGRPLVAFDAAAAPAAAGSWRNASVTVASPTLPQDLVEIVFESVHVGGGADGTIIAVDNIRYSIGACPTGPCSKDPCKGDEVCVEVAPTPRPSAGYKCVPPGYPVGDSTCSFEDWEDCSPLLYLNTTAGPGNQPLSMAGDKATWITYKWPGPGRNWPYSTGAPGPACGLTYLFAKLSDKAPKARARMLLKPFSGSRCLTFKFVMNGVNCGALRVYRAANGDYNRAILLWAAQGHQSSMWLQAVVSVSVDDLPSNATVEVIIEAERGSWPTTVPGYYATDFAVDELRYTSGTCDRNPMAPVA